jgi:hypothetical protein
MVRPSTNCSPIILTAAPTAWRITGSPSRAVMRFRKPPRSLFASSSTSTSRPVSISPQVEALTNRLSDWPRWLPQSAEPIFSAISRSRVSASGVRSSASARHISASPSRVPSENCWRKLSTTPCFFVAPRAPSTRAVASATMAARSRSLSGWRSSKPRTTSASSAYLPASIRSQLESRLAITFSEDRL